MRCSCRKCGEYMVHENAGLGACVCPVCGEKCTDCLGTDSVISKEAFERIKDDPVLQAAFISDIEDEVDTDE